jgi:hypothetical protein
MDRYVTHASFTLERSYPVPPARVFGPADQLKALATGLESTGLESNDG